MSKITEQIEEIIQPVLDDLNFELVEIEFTKEGKDRFLRISIDKEGGVDLNDCTLASEKISEVMDEEDPIEQMYYLDVASPGAERPIKNDKAFRDAVDQPVFVSLYAPIEGSKEWLGVLQSVTDDHVVIKAQVKEKKKEVEIPRNKIAKARHAVLI
ncbi:transcription termination protein NusA-like protein [Staphylococcus piscifermentans]|uniref:Ribosome maturation factor RimP n=2 Tax=Staphylococcus TaxID=1279 RepID=A0A239U5N3_9STAP|nr:MULTISPECIES: ribosome maturation factor RimP [Staphylococcus]AYU55078.1 ribosome maturation factor RimP [Staphylococcus debuckii]RTX82379.1 ribosome maturation factor RimP [Staphylococcus piscifermentans]GEP84269.1 ribosome maturation factor RimP [Staphylococcus piscifermentans]SNV05337.1 transcription termination protein NusA-like protein [Staphylococcus piscifermentans]